jgi:hypothetical protein
MGKLPEGIAAHLPVGADQWLQVGQERGKKLQPFDLAFSPLVPGVLLHYDLTNKDVMLRGCEFSDDPRFSPFAERAAAMTVVNIRPPVQQLVSQLVGREFGRGTRMQLAIRKLALTLNKAARHALNGVIRLTPQAILTPLKRIEPVSKRWSRLHTTRTEYRLESVRRYASSNWLEGIYEDWDATLDNFAVMGIPVKRIFVAPAPEDHQHRWRLISVAESRGSPLQKPQQD